MTDRKIAEAFPPGEFIKEELEARGWSQVELAEIIGRQPKVVNDLILNKRSITPEIAKALGETFDNNAQYWMNLESAYQLWRVKIADNVISRRSKLYQIAPIKEMIKRNWIEYSENIDILEKRVMQFFEIPNLDKPISYPHVARRGTKEILPAHKAWLFRAKQLAHAVHAKIFSERSFKNGLTQLKKLLANTVDARHVPKILAEAGIRFIVLEHLPKTKIDGVNFWLDKKSPVIALSLRFDRIDGFWYTLAHELGHIKYKNGLNRVILDTDLMEDDIQNDTQIAKIEQRADLFAAEFLIEHSEIEDFIARVRPLYGKQKIINFANRIGVHPGIVVGQLQFRKEIPWSSYRQMLEKVRSTVTQSTLTDGWGQTLPILMNKEI